MSKSERTESSRSATTTARPSWPYPSITASPAAIRRVTAPPPSVLQREIVGVDPPNATS